MIKYLRNLTLLFLLPVFFISINCSKEVTKEKADPQLAQPNKIPPGHAEIIGKIMEIESVVNTRNGNDPCSKAPCLAKVMIESVDYGAGFPTLNKNEKIKVKFSFTLEPTTKEMFPNMDESYPGLKIGDKFKALVSFVSAINSDKPEFIIYGYSVN